jgi:hypothetical protein
VRAGHIVLDRQRLAPYTDDATQFDNRYLPALPAPDVLGEWGVRRVLHVTPSASDQALADVQDELALYESSGLEVKLVAADSFAPDPSERAADTSADSATGSFADSSSSDWGHTSGHYYYGGRASSHNWFWHDYPWSRSRVHPDAAEPSFARPGRSYRASAAAASSGAHLLGAAALGTVAVAVSRQTGRIMGAFHSRSGSWNRAQGGYGG